MIKKGKIGKFYQFSSNEYLSIKKIVEKIYRKKHLNPKKFIINVKDRPGKDKDYKIIDYETRKLLKWQNRVSIDRGINEVINWYHKYSNKFEKKDEKFSINK